MKLSDGRFDIKRAWVLLFAAFFTVTVLLLIDSSLSDISLAALVFTVLIFAVCILFAYKIKLPHFALLLGAIALAVRLVLVFTVPTAVESDFAVLLNASRSLIGGDMSHLSSDYFSLWAYQNGFVAFQSLLLLIWDNVLILKLANCIFASATVVLVYLIAKEFAGEKASRAAALIYCFLPFPLFYVTVLTNQFSASFLIYLGLYIFVSERFTVKRYLKCIVLGILLAFANVLRPESIIPLFAVILFILLTISKSNAKESLLCIVILLAVYFVLGKLLSFVFVISGLSPDGLVNNAPYWKFVLGFNHETGGIYADSDTVYLSDPDAAWELVLSRIFVPISELLMLFKLKLISFWNGGGVQWAFCGLLDSEISLFGKSIPVLPLCEFLQHISRYMLIALYLLVIVGLAVKYGDKAMRHDNVVVFANQVFVTLGVYLLIEVQAWYAYSVQVSVAILAALGLSLLNPKKNRQ